MSDLWCRHKQPRVSCVPCLREQMEAFKTSAWAAVVAAKELLQRYESKLPVASTPEERDIEDRFARAVAAMLASHPK